MFPLLGSLAPMRIINRRVLEQRGEHKHETRDQIDIDGLDVRDARQRGAHARADRGHREHGGDAQSDARRRGLVVYPK